MGAVLVLDPACDALAGRLRSTAALLARLGSPSRLYPDANGDVPPRPGYPYVSVEGAGETPYHTMGPDAGGKWGGVARVQVRVASQLRSDQDVRSLTSLVKQALDGQAVTVPGFGLAGVTFVSLIPLEDVVAGVKTREWISEYEVLAHQ